MSIAAWPEALELHRKLLDKYIGKGNYKLVAYIDTPTGESAFNLWNSNLRSKAIEISNKWAHETMVVPPEIHENRRVYFPKTKELTARNANLRAADTLQHIFNIEIKDQRGQVLLLDNDMFLTNYLRLPEYNLFPHIKAVKQISRSRFLRREVEYLWSGLLFFNLEKIRFLDEWSFDCGKVRGVPVDVSGQTNYWLEKYKELELVENITFIEHLPSLTWDEKDMPKRFGNSIREFISKDNRNFADKFYIEIYDSNFLHFRAGSNWNRENPEIVKARNLLFITAMENEFL